MYRSDAVGCAWFDYDVTAEEIRRNDSLTYENRLVLEGGEEALRQHYENVTSKQVTKNRVTSNSVKSNTVKSDIVTSNERKPPKKSFRSKEDVLIMNKRAMLMRRVGRQRWGERLSYYRDQGNDPLEPSERERLTRMACDEITDRWGGGVACNEALTPEEVDNLREVDGSVDRIL